MHETHYPVTLDEEFVEFERTGAPVKGEFSCTACGYGVMVTRELPRCPMCGEELWERSRWTPFTSVLSGLRSRLD